MFAEERYVRIMEVVNQAGKATVAELSEALGVSQVTVRRDLEKLEEKELLLRTHGGAMALHAHVSEVAHEKSFSEKEEALVEEKERIAEAAAKLISDEDAVMLTPGTTNMLIAKRLIGKKGLKIVTNAANIAVQIGNYPELEIILIGGKLRRKSFALVGPLAEETLQNIRVDKLFLGVDGFDLKEGLTTPNLAEASMDRQMISIAKEVIVVADHTKFGKVFFSHVATLGVVHTVITDEGINRELAGQIRELGIRLIIV
ncbi:DeoR/GlpR family DNA-binding transcription regulator [Paenibacillus koleovorans]|uniref:DeoR/GlpR family DNA-binding transcription regulator n=1 Tax=Paenibacillus koleovorans TaxID=121608 RepID=UPI000FDBA506|nr:DeoR/GlpR family DNA-binding transcription regulator [Paenibacillus koleovorans]